MLRAMLGYSVSNVWTFCHSLLLSLGKMRSATRFLAAVAPGLPGRSLHSSPLVATPMIMKGRVLWRLAGCVAGGELPVRGCAKGGATGGLARVGNSALLPTIVTVLLHALAKQNGGYTRLNGPT